MPIQISVYPDRIVFWNPGQLPESWTVGSLLKKHPSRAFNPAIANAFFRCGEVEAWGRGIGKIVNGAIAEKLLPPVFDASLGGLMVTFFSSPAAQLKEAGISERGIQAVEFALKNGRITNTDVQEMAKVSKPTATRLLTSLSDYLELKGTTGKGTYYTVKGLTKGSRQHCFVLLNTRTCLEGNPHVHRPCGIGRFRSLSDSQIYYREHQTSSIHYIVELTL